MAEHNYHVRGSPSLASMTREGSVELGTFILCRKFGLKFLMCQKTIPASWHFRSWGMRTVDPSPSAWTDFHLWPQAAPEPSCWLLARNFPQDLFTVPLCPTGTLGLLCKTILSQ